MVKWLNVCMISGTLRGRVTDIAHIYADGVFLKTITSPFKTSTVTLPDNTRLLSVNATNVGGKYGFIIKLSNGFVTDTHWRCSNTYIDNWNKPNYNDADWQPAIIAIWPSWWPAHGLNPAKIIWAKTYADTVYCRGWSSKYYRHNST